MEIRYACNMLQYTEKFKNSFLECVSLLEKLIHPIWIDHGVVFIDEIPVIWIISIGSADLNVSKHALNENRIKILHNHTLANDNTLCIQFFICKASKH